ncbi:hypothetical protein GOP47_0008693 [Adiantum capillus-veneris]|uniref:Uncharacterized protein n=1 Tax=Adiantum capillus-veneris TaxID=13818 RepID=A0A9D4ZIA0_ADICA|nr:hypothetical protein GOP47_0008693 [Adiantum capillus-veneris]
MVQPCPCFFFSATSSWTRSADFQTLIAWPSRSPSSPGVKGHENLMRLQMLRTRWANSSFFHMGKWVLKWGDSVPSWAGLYLQEKATYPWSAWARVWAGQRPTIDSSTALQHLRIACEVKSDLEACPSPAGGCSTGSAAGSKCLGSTPIKGLQSFRHCTNQKSCMAFTRAQPCPCFFFFATSSWTRSAAFQTLIAWPSRSPSSPGGKGHENLMCLRVSVSGNCGSLHRILMQSLGSMRRFSRDSRKALENHVLKEEQQLGGEVYGQAYSRDNESCHQEQRIRRHSRDRCAGSGESKQGFQRVGNRITVRNGLRVAITYLLSILSTTKVNNSVNMPKFGISGICRLRTQNILKYIIVNAAVECFVVEEDLGFDEPVALASSSSFEGRNLCKEMLP